LFAQNLDITGESPRIARSRALAACVRGRIFEWIYRRNGGIFFFFFHPRNDF